MKLNLSETVMAIVLQEVVVTLMSSSELVKVDSEQRAVEFPEQQP
jgi:hypothetical protein